MTTQPPAAAPGPRPRHHRSHARRTRPAAGTAGRPARAGGARRPGHWWPRPPAAWWPALRSTPVSLWNDDVSDYAAALTYYAILAVLPALLATVVAFGLISPGTAERFIAQVTTYAPAQSGAELHAVLARMLRADSATWTLLVTGSGSALWSASSYLAVFRRALHRMHRVEDHRSPWRTAHRIVLTALVLLGLLVVSALVLLLTGSVAEALGRLLGLDGTVAWAWSLLRWPLLMFLAFVLVVVVFHTGPRQARRRRHSLPGGVLAAALWLGVSAGFALYASALGAYSRLYGSLAGVVVFLIWLWLSNLALLTGAQFTAELSRAAARRAT
ncbi:YihY/virulence factor BrkB family protein [Streptomyces tropicalis]|uniref:YihY/virulence factor BrkB family protein n=1 Tax=Streptomyces tropicalis TaxID=3034234 RepID=A0ABT6A388_9ACTN|nr:YihY/virulence factor BrkB family protein [Streptomyces tropicalis]MDF3299110.1 YihY/virulence factor BrkB family protein [Streptomyces tropicalis]